MLADVVSDDINTFFIPALLRIANIVLKKLFSLY